MTSLAVDGLTFTFPNARRVGQSDEGPFYRQSLSRMLKGLKAVDIIAIDPTGVAWLIEVTDYRQHPRSKPSELPDEMAWKAVHTLAAMTPASVHAHHDAEKLIAKAVAGTKAPRVVLHVEQPRKHTKLFPRALDPADLQQKLRQRVGAIDPIPRPSTWRRKITCRDDSRGDRETRASSLIDGAARIPPQACRCKPRSPRPPLLRPARATCSV